MSFIGCTSAQDSNQPPTPVYTLEENTLYVSLEGYKESCTEPVISIMAEDGSWQPTNNVYFLPDLSMLYLNGNYDGHMACDHVVCNPLPESFKIRLLEYQLIGERPSPEEGIGMVPAYQTEVLTGTLKIEMETFSDEACQEKQMVSVVIENN